MRNPNSLKIKLKQIILKNSRNSGDYVPDYKYDNLIEDIILLLEMKTIKYRTFWCIFKLHKWQHNDEDKRSATRRICKSCRVIHMKDGRKWRHFPHQLFDKLRNRWMVLPGKDWQKDVEKNKEKKWSSPQDALNKKEVIKSTNNKDRVIEESLSQNDQTLQNCQREEEEKET